VTRVAITPADPDDADARTLIAELGAELTRLTGHFTAASYSPSDAFAPRSLFIIARDDAGRAVGCGAIRPLGTEHDDRDVGELKRMYARPGTHGVGHAILTHLERAAREFGYTELWLETGVENERAIRFYERHGYERIANFGPYAGSAAATCLGKQLLMADG
jgi:ribosomal protein S18 acetylase RimI-like enzyme